jgi:hypothetical protein
MADYHFGGSEEENAELRKLEVELVWRAHIYPQLVHNADLFVI